MLFIYNNVRKTTFALKNVKWEKLLRFISKLVLLLLFAKTSLGFTEGMYSSFSNHISSFRVQLATVFSYYHLLVDYTSERKGYLQIYFLSDVSITFNRRYQNTPSW